MLAAETVATLAPVATQSTATGREIHRLTLWNGRVYAAYGDYDANTGPIHVLSVHTDTLAVSDEATLTTEETWDFRDLNGVLHVPFYDPQQGSAEPVNGQYATATSPGSWTVHANVTPVPVHVHDAAVTSEGLWLCGSTDVGGDRALVWHSPDNGATWVESLSLEGPFDRFYCMLAVGDDLLVGRHGSAETLHYRPSGGPWQEIAADGRQFSSMTAFTVDGADIAVVVPWQKLNGKAEALGPVFAVGRPADSAAVAAFNAAVPRTSAFGVAVAGADLYLLTSDRRLRRCDSSGVWTLVGTVADPLVSCLEADVDGGFLYFGTTDSRVLRCPIPG